MDIIKTCALCGKTYIGHSMASLYCSSTCSCRASRLKKRERALEKREKSQGIISYKIDTSDFIKKEYISMKELAIYLSVSRVTAYRYIVSGLIKGQIKSKSAFTVICISLNINIMHFLILAQLSHHYYINN